MEITMKIAIFLISMSIVLTIYGRVIYLFRLPTIKLKVSKVISKLKKKRMEYIGDVAVNCLKDNELIAIVTNSDKSTIDKEIADREIRRRKLKL